MTDPAVAIDPTVVVVRVGGSTAAYIPGRRELVELSSGSVSVLDRIDADLDPVRGRIDAELVDQLLALDVLQPSPPTTAAHGPARGRGDSVAVTEATGGDVGTASTVELPSVRRVDSTTLGPYAALDHCFTVSLDDPALADELRHDLADLEVTSPDGIVPYSIVASGGRLTLRRAGSIIATGERSHVLGMLLWDLNCAAVDSVTDDVVLHAGAVTRHGGAIVLPGAQESGKTTLVTALVRAGSGYLSDELSAIAALESPVVRPYPKVLSVDPGSWDLFPDLAPASHRADLSPTQWLLRAEDVRPGAAERRPAPLRAVVFPSYRPSRGSGAQRLEPLEALRRLAECTFGFHDRPDVLLPRLAVISESIPAWALDVGHRIGDAVAAVDAVAAAPLSAAVQ